MREIVLECCDKGWRRINAEDLKPLFNKHRRDRKARTATEIDDAASAWQLSRPLPYFFHSNCIRPGGAIATISEKFFRDRFVSVGSMHVLMVASSQSDGRTAILLVFPSHRLSGSWRILAGVPLFIDQN